MADPSPWEVVNDYTKTVVTVASGLLAFSVTFQSSIGDRGPFELLVVSWGLFVVAVATALFSAARLTSHLRNSSASPTLALLFSNIAYFALFLGVACFFAYALLGQGPKGVNAESERAIGMASTYAATVDPVPPHTYRLDQVAWDASVERWLITLSAGTHAVRLAVAHDGTVRDYQRISIGIHATRSAGADSANALSRMPRHKHAATHRAP